MEFCQECGAEVGTDVKFCGECGSDVMSGPQAVEGTSLPNHPGENGFAAKHAIIVGLLGLIPSIILAIIIPGQLGAAGLLVGIPLFAYLGYQRPTAKTAFGRQSFWSAIMLFMSPIMMIVHTFVFASTQTDGAAEEAGAAIGGTILVGLAFVVGLPLGIAFYIISSKFDIDED